MNTKIAVLMIGLVLVGAGAGFGQVASDEKPVISNQDLFTKQIQIPESAEIIEINHHIGNVVVIGWEKPFILLEGTKEVVALDAGKARNALESIQMVAFTKVPNRLAIEYHGPGSSEDVDVEDHKVDITLQVPRQMALDMDVRHGGVTVNNMASPVSIDHRYGDVEVEDIDDKCQIRSREGNIKVRHIEKSLKLDTSEGIVEVEDVDGNLAIRHQEGEVTVKNIGGRAIFNCYKAPMLVTNVRGRLEIDNRRADVECRNFYEGLDLYVNHGTVKAEPGHILKNSYYCRVDDGDLILRIPEESSALFDLTVENGRIHSEFHVKVWAEGKLSIAKGAIHDGRNMVSCVVRKGSVSLLKSIGTFPTETEQTYEETTTLPAETQPSGKKAASGYTGQLTPARVQ